MRYMVLALIVSLAGCGRSERAAQSFVEIEQAAQAQLLGASVPQTARTIRAHSLVGLKTLGYELTQSEESWLIDQLPQ